ncbi:MAG: hypothetical protein KJ718_01735 [Nanoarchaeota archaeon]|nr:hypothetical protein [Nanoarchaeota archaeon]
MTKKKTHPKNPITMPITSNSQRPKFTKKKVLLEFSIKSWEKSEQFIEEIKQLNKKFPITSFWCSPYVEPDKPIPVESNRRLI